MENERRLSMIRRTLSIMMLGVMAAAGFFLQAAESGAFSYDDFDSPGKSCNMCHQEIYREWKQSLMSQSFTHEWDGIEYFKLALPHALSLEKVAGVKSGCIACHAPLAYFSGDIPPKPVAAKTRANEGAGAGDCKTLFQPGPELGG